MDTPILPATGPSPVAAPAISGAVKTAGFFTGKVIAAIIGVAAVGGGIGVGYFGKYIGLPAPAAMEQRAASEEDTPKETKSNAGDSEKTAGDNDLLNALPGADANYVTYFQKTDEAATVVNELVNEAEKKFGKEIGDLKETFGTPDEQMLIDIASGITQVLVVAKIDYDAVKNKRGLDTNPFESELPLAVALKIPAEKETAFLEAVKTLQSLKKNGEENPFKKISVEGRGNGIIIITNPSHPLDGKFSDNPLKAIAEKTATDMNVFIAFDLRTVVEKAVLEAEKEINEKSGIAGNEVMENLAGTSPMQLEQEKQQLELMKKVQNLVLSGALKKENEKSNLKIDVQIGMTDEESAQKLLEFVQPQMEQLNFMIPPDYQSFLKMEPRIDKGDFVFELTVEDLVAIEQKIFAALETSRRPREMTKPLIDESPANLPNLNQPDPSVVEGKVRRKK